MRYVPLAADGDIDLTLLAPERWYENDGWLEASPSDSDLTTILAPIRLPRAGRARWYMHYYPHMKEIVRQVKPDVIHLWEEPWSAVAAQAVCLRNRLSPDAAMTIEVEQNIDRRLPLPFELVRRFTLKSTDHLIGRHPDADEGCSHTRLHWIRQYRGIWIGSDYILSRPEKSGPPSAISSARKALYSVMLGGSSPKRASTTS